RLRIVAVVNYSNRQAAFARIHSGVRIGVMFEQQLRNLQMISATGFIQRASVRSGIFGRIWISAAFEQQADDVQMTFPRRIGQRADARRVEAGDEAGIFFQELLDTLQIAGGGGDGDVVVRPV